jgi:hypothetical protein
LQLQLKERDINSNSARRLVESAARAQSVKQPGLLQAALAVSENGLFDRFQGRALLQDVVAQNEALTFVGSAAAPVGNPLVRRLKCKASFWPIKPGSPQLAWVFSRV